MTPEQEACVQALVQLISSEKDHEKIAVFAAELEGLLSLDGKPRASVRPNQKPTENQQA